MRLPRLQLEPGGRWLGEGDVMTRYGPGLIAEARVLLASGRVSVQPARGDAAASLRAWVDDQRIEQVVVAGLEHRDLRQVRATCSCGPRACAHVVATLLAACADATRAAPAPAPTAARLSASLASFAVRLQRELRPSPAAAGRPAAALTYVLTALPRAGETGPRVTLALGALRTKLRKDGAPPGVLPLPLEREPERDRLALEPADERLLALLRTQAEPERGFARNAFSVALEGVVGADLLELAVATGRCSLAGTGHAPLVPGPARCAHLAWRLTTDGRYRCTLEVPGETLLLCLDPGVWLDPAADRLGPLELAAGRELARLWLEAPPVPAEELPAFHQHLARAGVDLGPVRLPAPLPLRPAPAVAPVPVLQLRSDDDPVGELEHARVEFDYDGARVGAESAQSRIVRPRADHLAVLERDRLRERAALAQLARFHFEPAGSVAIARHRAGVPATDLVLTRPPGPADRLDVESPVMAPVLAVSDDARWADFVLHGVPLLLEQGWRVEMEPGFRFRIQRPRRTFARLVHEVGGWLDLALGVELDGETIDLLPVLAGLIETGAVPELLASATPEVLLPLPDGRRLLLPRARVQHWLTTLLELGDRSVLIEDKWLRFTRRHVGLFAELVDGNAADAEPIEWHGDDGVLALGRKLRDRRGVPRVAAPVGLQATLRPYQRDGVSRLQFYAEHELGGLLADDMGLGKTVQVLAHLLLEHECGRLDSPALVVAPASVIWNWQAEAARFAPSLRVLVWHGQARADVETFLAQDVVITSYALLARDQEVLALHHWHAVVLDEAQAIKNAGTETARAACSLRARHRLCLTGTPIENHLGELWSLFQFALPGLLGTRTRFLREFGSAGRNPADPVTAATATALRRRIAPFVLRRTKDKVAKELPAKTEIVRRVQLEGAQRDLYETVRVAARHEIEQALLAHGLEQSHLTILTALLRLRQVCCDPRLLARSAVARAAAAVGSAKHEALFELLRELIAADRRVLVFSQFTAMLELLEPALARESIGYVKLTGTSRDRKAIVASFQEGDAPVFLISLKAGGTGLNLTAADTVIHYDPWWNPAVEAQATDRAHRLGQTRPVFVYKLIAAGTIEDRILALQERKRALYDAVLGDGQLGKATLTKADLDELLRPLP